MKLSLLIPVLLPRDEQSCNKLHAELLLQFKQFGLGLDVDAEILFDFDEGRKKIGRKRNDLIKRASGEYLAFIDADDMVSGDYIAVLMHGINLKQDCIALRGIITTNGVKPEVFEHSLRYSQWKTNKTGHIKHERTINHLNCIKSEVAKKFKFPETNWGEDHAWSKMVQASGLLKREYYTTKIMYYYQYKTKK